MKRIFFAAFSLISFVACSNEEKAKPKPASWDEPNKADFMAQCVSGAVNEFQSDTAKAKTYCACMLEKIEARYPVPDSAGKMSYNDMTALAKDCLK